MNVKRFGAIPVKEASVLGARWKEARRGKAKCDSDIIEWILDFKTPKSGPRERTRAPANETRIFPRGIYGVQERALASSWRTTKWNENIVKHFDGIEF